MKTQLQKTSKAKIKSAAQTARKPMVVKNEKKKNEEMEIFRALSSEAQQMRDVIAAATGEFLTVNEVLLTMYKEQTGCKQFKTFLQWKEEGFSVKKNEKCFRVWGAPLKAKSRDELPTNEINPEAETTETKYKFWPTSCLFNENQVQKNGDKKENKINSSDADNEIILKQSTEAISAENQAPEVENATLDIIENSAFVRADYVDHQENRRERLETRATKASEQSHYQYKRSHDMVSVIPFGQPILIAHHSERGHRRLLDRSWAAMGKCVALGNKAEHLASKAASVGSAGIASDDPEAIQKLRKKLDGLKRSQEKMKLANKLVKKGDKAGLIELGFDGKLLDELLNGDFIGRQGFPTYRLQNNNAEIRRTAQRIDELTKLRAQEPFSFSSDDFKVYVDNGRVRVKFNCGKPTKEVCTIMSKHFSFNWSRNDMEWTRKTTANALAVASQIPPRLNALEAIY